MTDTERRDLSERIATLAEAAGLSSELVWEAAETCPQGHSNRTGRTQGTATLCVICLYRHYVDEGYPHPIRRALEQCQTFNSDPEYHPEWRIGRKVKDLTDPTSLLPLVEAWRAQRRWRGWSVYTPVAGMFPDIEQATAIVVNTSRHFEAVGETPWEALALAFAEALEVQKGEDYDG